MGQKQQVNAELADQLVTLLDNIVDRELAGRLAEVMVSAARCIARLAGINLVALEPKEAGDGTADLGLWEKIAPAVGETVVAANELCATIEVCFPPVKGSVFGGMGSDQRAEYEAAAVFRTIGPLIHREVGDVGALVRRPELLSNAWLLLAELERLRTGIRARVSDAVYLSAAALGPVTRDQVVPGFQQEVTRALSFRGTESALRRTARQRLVEALPGAQLARALDKDFEAFCAMPAWRHVKVETKRAMLELREALGHVALSEGTSPTQVRALVEPMLEVLAQTSTDLSRGLLVGHDREARALALRRVEQAELHLTLGTGAAGWVLDAALDAASPLRGCNELLDELLRHASMRTVSELGDDELLPLAADFSVALTQLEL
jgi:hypothetical protein